MWLLLMTALVVTLVGFAAGEKLGDEYAPVYSGPAMQAKRATVTAIGQARRRSIKKAGAAETMFSQ